MGQQVPLGPAAESFPDLRRRFFRLSWINILSNVTVPLVGLVDTAMLGHLDDIRFLAGVALASVLFDYVYWTFGFLRMGTTGTTAQALGRGDTPEVYHVLWRSLALALLIAAGVLAIQLPLREVGFAVLSGSPEVEAAGRDYFNARIWGAPATLCGFVLVGWFLGRGESRRVLGIAVVANLTNIVLNYVFIVRLQMAARGAGLATALSQYALLAAAIALWLSRDRGPAPRRRDVLDRRRVGELFRLNRDILLRTLCLVTSFAIFINFSSVLGTAWLAANSILLRLLTVASYLIDGVAFASESLAGLLRGRRDTAGLRRFFRLSLLSGLGFAAGFLVILFATARPILAVLTSHGDVIENTTRYLPWLVPVLAFGSLAYMYDGLFLGLTEGRRLRNSMLLSTLLVFLPTASAALWVSNNDLLWAAMALFMAARALTLWRASRPLLGARQ